MIELFILFWIACGVFNYGHFMYFLQVNYPEIAKETFYSDRKLALCFSFAGPTTFIAVAHDFHSKGTKNGLMYVWKNPHEETLQ